MSNKYEDDINNDGLKILEANWYLNETNKDNITLPIFSAEFLNNNKAQVIANTMKRIISPYLSRLYYEYNNKNYIYCIELVNKIIKFYQQYYDKKSLQFKRCYDVLLRSHYQLQNYHNVIDIIYNHILLGKNKKNKNDNIDIIDTLDISYLILLANSYHNLNNQQQVIDICLKILLQNNSHIDIWILLYKSIKKKYHHYNKIHWLIYFRIYSLIDILITNNKKRNSNYISSKYYQLYVNTFLKDKDIILNNKQDQYIPLYIVDYYYHCKLVDRYAMVDLSLIDNSIEYKYDDELFHILSQVHEFNNQDIFKIFQFKHMWSQRTWYLQKIEQ